MGRGEPACLFGWNSACKYLQFFFVCILRKKHEGRGWELEGSEMCINLIDLIKFN